MMTFGTIDVTKGTIEQMFFNKIKDYCVGGTRNE